MLLKKWGKWSVNSKKIGKRGRKPQLVIVKDDLRGAKRPPDWLIELQEYLADDTGVALNNDKIA